ncbi:hypothetical protein HAX54_016325, partial [Datura stramonium]|nr:hypothetical protein [Datura stramonium]
WRAPHCAALGARCTAAYARAGCSTRRLACRGLPASALPCGITRSCSPPGSYLGFDMLKSQ